MKMSTLHNSTVGEIGIPINGIGLVVEKVCISEAVLLTITWSLFFIMSTMHENHEDGLGHEGLGLGSSVNRKRWHRGVKREPRLRAGPDLFC